MQNLPSIYQLSSDFVKQLFRIQIQKGGKVLLWNQVKSKMEACYPELILETILQLKVEFKEIEELKGSLSYQWRPINAESHSKKRKQRP